MAFLIQNGFNHLIFSVKCFMKNENGHARIKESRKDKYIFSKDSHARQRRSMKSVCE